MSTETFQSGHLSTQGFDDDEAEDPSPVSEMLESYYQKHEALRGVPAQTIRKAWFTMAHMLLPPGAKVADMGCLPEMTYAMAVFNPQIQFIGVDTSSRVIKKAEKNFVLPNLTFRQDDYQKPASFEEGSLDGIINSYNLHEIFSIQKYSERAVRWALERHFALLKKGGQMFIRGYDMLPPEEYVLLEMPDIESTGEDLSELSEADLLLWYAAHARPRGDKTCKGFFLEELPPRFPQTRLFRLPSKWAYEFIMRKDDREQMKTDLAMEYTFFTKREYRKNLRALGARVLYSSPHWDDAIIRERFEGSFRLYTDEGKPMGPPATSFVAIAQKMGERKSLRLQERRPSQTTEHQIRMTAMRNEMSGDIFDIVTRDMDVTEVLPYRITANGELNIFVHEGLPRGIANAVPRTGKSIDGKRWSGHMTEAITVPTDAIYDVEKGEPKATVLFARDYLGLKPAMGSVLEAGPSFYPAPDFIDEQIKTRYLQVVEHDAPIEPRKLTRDLEGFAAKGRIREISAQSILNAISVGYIPNARLESQILDLFEKLGLKAETWSECPLALDIGTIDSRLDTKKIMSNLAGQDKRFKDIKGSAGQLRTVKSTFVDEGWVEGGIEGLASRDIEFVIADDQTVNKAVVLPLTKDAQSGAVMGGMVPEYLPVPQRQNGNGLTLRAPSVTLPKEIVNIDQAKRFIAEKFDVPPEKVARMGESYFCHIGMTPVRIFPFCVATTGEASNPFGGPVEFAPMVELVHMMFRVGDFNNDQFILGRYRSLFTRTFDSEVTGDWVFNSRKIYQETLETKPAVANATNATGLSASGWSVQKARKEAEHAEKLSASTYVTSPDFFDIHEEAHASGYVASVGPQDNTPENTADPNNKENKSKQ